MRTVASVAVPTTTPVRFDLHGTFDVGGIIFYNASPSTLTVATLDGAQLTAPANYWIKIVPSATHIFDGALLVTAQTQIASTAQSAMMWADVYAPGEALPAGDSGPIPNQMTGGNQQPRVIAISPSPAINGQVFAADVSSRAVQTLQNLAWPANNPSSICYHVYSFYIGCLVTVTTITTGGFLARLQLQAANVGGNVGAALTLFTGYVAVGSDITWCGRNPISQTLSNPGGTSPSVALQLVSISNSANIAAAQVFMSGWAQVDIDGTSDSTFGQLVPTEGGGFSGVVNVGQYAGTSF